MVTLVMIGATGSSFDDVERGVVAVVPVEIMAKDLLAIGDKSIACVIFVIGRTLIVSSSVSISVLPLGELPTRADPTASSK
jgi:hypothetical protein